MVNIYYLISLFYAKGCGTWGAVLALISSFQLLVKQVFVLPACLSFSSNNLLFLQQPHPWMYIVPKNMQVKH